MTRRLRILRRLPALAGMRIGCAGSPALLPPSNGAAGVISSDAANLFHPTVSPDGRWIAATPMQHARALHRVRLMSSREH